MSHGYVKINKSMESSAMDENGYTIAKFADAAGVGVETVRYYQRRGLLPVPQARAASYRRYDQSLVSGCAS